MFSQILEGLNDCKRGVQLLFFEESHENQVRRKLETCL